MFSNIAYQSALFLPIVLSIYLSYRVLRCTDLTVEGSYVLGASVFAKLILLTHNLPLSFVIGSLMGVFSGLFVAWIQKNIPSLLASIIVLFMLTSINLQIMGVPNIHLPHNSISPMVVYAVSAMFIAGMIGLLCSPFGLKLRAYGSNPQLLKRLNYPARFYLLAGLAIGNIMASLAGVLNAQVNGYSDIFMGQGLALTAVGIVTITLKFSQRFSAWKEVSLCVITTILYHVFLNLFLSLGIDTVNLKIILGFILIVILTKQRYVRA